MSSPLHHAAATNNPVALQNGLTRASPANINVGDHRGFTPFHVGCAAGHVACVNALLRAGCDTALLNDTGLTGWQLAEQLKRDKVLALRPAGFGAAVVAGHGRQCRRSDANTSAPKTKHKKDKNKEQKRKRHTAADDKGRRSGYQQNREGSNYPEESNQLKSDRSSKGSTAQQQPQPRPLVTL